MDGTFTGKDGVNSKQDFLNNPKAQENALNIYKKIQWQYLKPYHKYVGQTINGIKITPSGMLAGAHNGGHGGVIRYITSQGKEDPTDGNGIHVSKYMKNFQDYDVFEWTGQKYDNKENSETAPIKDVNDDIKKKHDEKKVLNKKSENIDNILSTKDRIILHSILHTYQNTDKHLSDKFRLNHTLPKVLRAVAKTNNLPLPVVSEFLIQSIKLYKNHFSNSASNSNGHWVTINGNHVFIEDK